MAIQEPQNSDMVRLMGRHLCDVLQDASENAAVMSSLVSALSASCSGGEGGMGGYRERIERMTEGADAPYPGWKSPATPRAKRKQLEVVGLRGLSLDAPVGPSPSSSLENSRPCLRLSLFSSY